MTTPRPLLGLATLLTLAGCENLGEFAPNRCGNLILELDVGEDCDTYAGEARCGAPGTARACRLICDPAAAPTGCPEGWSCGLDGICRARSKSFSDPTVLPLPGGELSVADFDGDGRDDLVILGADGLAFAFADADGRFDNTQSVAIEAPVADPLIADVDDDGKDDLLYPTDDGMIVFAGNATRAPVARAVPFERQPADEERVWFVTMRPLAPSRDELVIGFYGSPTGYQLDTVGYQAAVTASEVQAFLSTGDLVEIGVGDIDVSEIPTDDELVVAVEGGGALMVVTAHCFLEPFPGGCRLLPRATVELPMNLSVSLHGGRIADVDADGAPDLVIDAVRRRGPMGGANDPVVLWARGDGRGGFEPPAPHPQLIEAIVCPDCPGSQGRLLDAADVNGDGHTDYLATRGLLVRTSTTEWTFEVHPSTTPWQTGELEDLNRDGRLDVIASRPDALDVALATPEGQYNTFHAPVSGVVSRFAVGDFDGDLVGDVAVIEDRSRLAVIFGSATGAPRTRILMAEVPSTVALAGGRLPGPAADGVDDLLIAVDMPSSEAAEGEIGLVRFEGATSRRLTAEAPMEPRVQVFSVGRFEPDAPGPQMLVGGRRAGNWVFSIFDGASLTRFGEVTSRSLEFEADSTLADCGVTGEMGLVLTSTGGAPGGQDRLYGAVARPVPIGTTLEPRLLSFEIRGGKLSCEASAALQTSAARRLELEDFDGDGALDAIVGFEDSGMGDEENEDPLPVAVWWGAGDGFSSPTAYTELGDEALRPVFVPGEADDDDDDELLLVGETSIYLADVTREGLLPTVIASLDRQRAQVNSIARLDVNGDGLEDVVVSTGDEVIGILQVPCTQERVDLGQCTREVPR